MNKWKKFIKALLYPHIAVLILLVPIATALLVFSMIYLGTESIVSYISYVLAFYTLTILCLKIPNIISFFKKVKNENKYIQRYLNDPHLRINISLYGSLLWNVAYAIFQLGLGFFYKTFWYYSMSIYYVLLSVMRFFLVKHTKLYKPGEKIEIELKKYRFCGCLLLLMNLSLTIIIFFMVYWNRTFVHHQIITIAMATYTFTSFTLAIINFIKYRKYKSPVYSASKIVSLISACVSMLTLETTMLTTFGTAETLSFNRIMLGITGGVISIFVVIVAIIMIVNGTKKLKILKGEKYG